MAVPSQTTYSVSAVSAFGTALLALLDAGASPAYINLRSATDVLLAQIILTDPAGTVSGTTGQLTLMPAAATTALVDGTVAYSEICSSAGTVHLAQPAAAGTVAVSGFTVVNSLVLVAGAPVSLVSAVVG